jgi:copper(I)-binding protein
MFHESRNESGVARMMMIDTVRIEPHSEVSFAPDGFHIMLMQPTRSIQPGDHVLLTLRFSDGLSLPVHFEVRRSDGSAVKRTTDAARP